MTADKQNRISASSDCAPTPASLGYYMPAEWAPHSATWITWPHNERNWPGRFEAIPAVFARMVFALQEGEDVHLAIQHDAAEASARRELARIGCPLDRIHFHRIPTNLGWMRDCGPIFLINHDSQKPMLALDWDFNTWGGKYPPFDSDNTAAANVAEIAGVQTRATGMILEGGSIEPDGNGLLLTTESVLLNPNRNPQLSREEIETILKDNLGVRKILWLGDGIEGDDTDGHIDDLARFVAPGSVLAIAEDNPNDVNYEALHNNLKRLRGMTDAAGNPLKIRELPMPDPVIYEDTRLPASYANFYIGNKAVLLPVFDCPEKDERAKAILRECFPERKIVPIPCIDLIWGFGAFHCLTQQQPA